MEQIRFEAPTDYYDERISETDEQICRLIKQRKELFDNNPGFPTKNYITDWSKKYDFEELFLNYVFADFLNEEFYKPAIEPKNFQKNIPVLKAIEKKDTFYSVTLVRQFENVSVVHFNINSNATDESSEWDHTEFKHYKLSIKSEDTQFECRNEGGGGNSGNHSYTFIVSPALPDDVSQYNFVFTEYSLPSKKDTDFEFVI